MTNKFQGGAPYFHDQTLWLQWYDYCGQYSRAATNQGRHLLNSSKSFVRKGLRRASI